MKIDGVNIRTVCKSLLCFLLGRVYIMKVNPVAVATLLVVNSNKNNGRIYRIAVVLGILSCIFSGGGCLNGGDVIKYLLISMCILSIEGLAGRKNITAGRKIIVCMGAAVTFLIDLGGGLLDIRSALMLAGAEAVALIILVNLMYRGIEWLDYGKPGYYMNGEQMISVIICITLGAVGIPDIMPDLLMLKGMVYNIFLLYMSYQYGIAAGAMTGAAIGIVMGLSEGNIAIAGMYCMVGLCIGVVHEFGRFACILAWGLAESIVAMLYPEMLWNVDTLKVFLSAAVFFMLLPKSLFALKAAEDGEVTAVRYNYQYETSRKLGEFSQAFERVGNILKNQAGKRPVYIMESAGEIFTQLTNTVCGNCNNCDYCWGTKYHDTYHEALGMLECAENLGEIKTDNVSEEFLGRCIHFDELVNETNRQLAMSRFQADTYNRQSEMRLLMAEQMEEISKLVKRLKNDVLASDRVYINEERQIRDYLKSYGIKIEDINIYDKSHLIREIYINARTERGCVPVRQFEEILAEVMGCPYKALPSMPAVLAKKNQMLVFVNDVKYNVLTATARIAKDGEMVSGDNFSFMRLSQGKMIMTITDGMGSGKSAFCESEAVINMLEQLLEAGFGEEMALRFVNTTMVMSGSSEMFSTVDMCVIDLYSGMCDCIKYGAAATFIKKKNGVKVIDSDAMPIGIIPEMTYASTSYKLTDGDYVIMISDGVSDSFDGVDKEEVICRLIEDAQAVNAGDLAEYILDSAKKCNMCRAGDDMSVIVAGLWNKN